MTDSLQVLKGELLLNGKRYQIRELKKMSGYVMQVGGIADRPIHLPSLYLLVQFFSIHIYMDAGMLKATSSIHTKLASIGLSLEQTNKWGR